MQMAASANASAMSGATSPSRTDAASPKEDVPTLPGLTLPEIMTKVDPRQLGLLAAVKNEKGKGSSAFKEVCSAMKLREPSWQRVVRTARRELRKTPRSLPAGLKRDLPGGEMMEDEEYLQALDRTPTRDEKRVPMLTRSKRQDRRPSSQRDRTPFLANFGPPGLRTHAELRKMDEDALFNRSEGKQIFMQDLLSLENLNHLQEVFDSKLLARIEELFRDEVAIMDELGKDSGNPKSSLSEVDIRRYFERAREEAGLTMDELKEVLMEDLGLSSKLDHYLTVAFMKVDTNCNGRIDWDEFCMYVASEMERKDDFYSKQQFCALTPAAFAEGFHAERTVRILAPRIGEFHSISGDGVLCLWQIQNGQLNLAKTMEPFSLCKDSKPDQQNLRIYNRDEAAEEKSIWVIDMAYLPTLDKFILITSERDVCFFDGSTMELQGRITGFQAVATCLCVYLKPGIPVLTMLIGDRLGCVSILLFPHIANTLAKWRIPRKLGRLPESIHIKKAMAGGHVKFSRWKFHDDWSMNVGYVHSTGHVISVSCDKNASLVMVNFERITNMKLLAELDDIPHLKLPRGKAPVPLSHPIARNKIIIEIEQGVMSFDFSLERNSFIATGGLDRVIRLWDIHRAARPAMVLKGHDSAVLYLKFNESEQHLLSMSSDMAIRVWEVHEGSLLLTVRQGEHRIYNDLTAVNYHEYDRCVAIASGTGLAMLPLSDRDFLHLPHNSHERPVKCIKYNLKFAQVITGCEGSTIAVWDLYSGVRQTELKNAHSGLSLTAMALDEANSLLFTAARDGQVKMWNYHCSKHLATMELHERDKSQEKSRKREDSEHDFIDEVNALALSRINVGLKLVSVGFNPHINIHSDLRKGEGIPRLPEEMWKDDKLNKGHTTEISSVTAGSNYLIATGGYDGSVCIWNILSGQLYAKHSIADTLGIDESIHEFAKGTLAVTGMTFLNTRLHAENKADAVPAPASLVTCGMGGGVLFWNIRNGFWDAFMAPRIHGVVRRIACPDNDKFLVTCSSHGYVGIWDITRFGTAPLPHGEDTFDEIIDPEIMCEWQAHTKSINCVELMEHRSLLLTGSDDTSVRLWTLEGDFIGSFGQECAWALDQPGTFQHPRGPPDVATLAYLHPGWTAKPSGFQRFDSMMSTDNAAVAGGNESTKRATKTDKVDRASTTDGADITDAADITDGVDATSATNDTDNIAESLAAATAMANAAIVGAAARTNVSNGRAVKDSVFDRVASAMAGTDGLLEGKSVKLPADNRKAQGGPHDKLYKPTIGNMDTEWLSAKKTSFAEALGELEDLSRKEKLRRFRQTDSTVKDTICDLLHRARDCNRTLPCPRFAKSRVRRSATAHQSAPAGSRQTPPSTATSKVKESQQAPSATEQNEKMKSSPGQPAAAAGHGLVGGGSVRPQNTAADTEQASGKKGKPHDQVGKERKSRSIVNTISWPSLPSQVDSGLTGMQGKAAGGKPISRQKHLLDRHKSFAHKPFDDTLYMNGFLRTPGPMVSVPGPQVRHVIAQQQMKRKPAAAVFDSTYNKLNVYELKDMTLPVNAIHSFFSRKLSKETLQKLQRRNHRRQGENGAVKLPKI
ncbi:WD repeat-containing protein on Y chromosome-like isoform X1 [Sycon ciliatum]|uniref:WD repeat-containing protein on Y chromosome-like isoform X1 n=2 Tax=Sycon ciliatum TaxID=27933 RepID=UPI0031F71124